MEPTLGLTPSAVLDDRIKALAAALKPAQQSMHQSWRDSGLYYEHIDALRATAGDQATAIIAAAKLSGIGIHLGRALDAVRGSSNLDQDSIAEVAHNLVDILLGVLDAAEDLDADLGQQMLTQLTAAMNGYTAGHRTSKMF
ncbi:hypothetical protein [Phytohabitans kaempferiae]|uniref:Uncharacterized protein n=1 Tax=Phytohabitans kaempferiae TaxID=1620943 RepID=A0ABV6M1M5_9ACTN